MSKVLAEAPGEHCVTGVKHSGEAKGDVEVIAGVETYVSKPPTGDGTKFKKIILFFADVYGPLYINNKLIQDYFASHGFLVVGIDYFEGSPVQDNASKPDFELSTWIAGPRERAAILVPKWTESVKEKYGLPDTKYSAVGYCFGGPFVMEHGAKDLISAGAIVHPAFLNEEHFHNMRVPLLLSCAETDSTFGLENRRRAEDILVEAKGTYHFQVFSGVSHGFAIRGNPVVENERWAKEESARGIITWFERFSV